MAKRPRRRAVPGVTRIAVALLAVGSLAATAALPAAAAPAATPAAARTGWFPPATARTYAVGRTTETFVDASRPTAPNGPYPGASSRTLPTLVLYPAHGDPAGTADVDGAPPVRGRRFPLLVFSHGFGASGPAYEPVLRRFAQRGFVVAAPTFPLSNGNAPGGPQLLDYVNQPGDVSFVITQMLRLDRDRSSLLAGTFAPEQIAAAGHSLGAITTLGVAYNSCCQDPRIDAAAVLSGVMLPFPGGTYFTGLSHRPAPLFVVHGTADATVPYRFGQEAFEAAPPPSSSSRWRARRTRSSCRPGSTRSSAGPSTSSRPSPPTGRSRSSGCRPTPWCRASPPCRSRSVEPLRARRAAGCALASGRQRHAARPRHPGRPDVRVVRRAPHGARRRAPVRRPGDPPPA